MFQGYYILKAMYYYLVGVTDNRNQAFGLLTYSSKEKLPIGQVVVVPYGKMQTIGAIFKQATKPKFATKEIIKTIDQATLPADLLKALQWLSDYYIVPISTVTNNALPKGIDKQRRAPKPTVVQQAEIPVLPKLTDQQAKALKQINQHPHEAIIVHGVTGSGKTRLYLEQTKQTIAAGRSVIILTPEIGLTSQLVSTFEQHFSNIILVHSKLTESQRHKAWLQASASKEPVVVIGARSALFSPVSNLGLIVIDEFHDQAYKQSQAPKYDAINLAVTRASFCKAQVLLGSATPDVARYYRSKELKRPIVLLDKIANHHIKPPTTEVVDMTDPGERSTKSWLSKKLYTQIENNLKSGTQTMIYHNRRGTAPLLLCEDCGWTANCKRCSAPMTLHADTHKMQCHICGLQNMVPVNCPDCSNPGVITRGIGTKQIETDLGNLFPGANVQRFDTDNNKEDSLSVNYDNLKGEADIIVGTQMITKGLDLPRLTTVGVVLAEAGLNIPDYTTNERIFQQLYQVAGRVGRHTDSNTIIIQTYNSDSAFIKSIQQRNWHNFYSGEQHTRRQYNFPPFTHLLVLKNDYASQKAAQVSAQKFIDELIKIKGVEPLGPVPAFYERVRGRWRWQIVIKSTDRKKLQTIAKNLPKTGKWSFDLDPASLL